MRTCTFFALVVFVCVGAYTNDKRDKYVDVWVNSVHTDDFVDDDDLGRLFVGCVQTLVGTNVSMSYVAAMDTSFTDYDNDGMRVTLYVPDRNASVAIPTSFADQGALVACLGLMSYSYVDVHIPLLRVVDVFDSVEKEVLLFTVTLTRCLDTLVGKDLRARYVTMYDSSEDDTDRGGIHVVVSVEGDALREALKRSLDNHFEWQLFECVT